MHVHCMNFEFDVQVLKKKYIELQNSHHTHIILCTGNTIAGP